ncbi:tautomerase family protein [Ancylobacter dichloromethanicus]|uniref:4-oxalocrotonate tautomerase n=1 Tax=Ancylobacter dichloromethanicus TaxID=518825 RepID=A0A9W6JD03_9HYPH|nr:tautomerase family protein [Ancylobacter dichloromethanicus]MBS7556625.1 tautomerase family protein [Ancylobacter dichloromethanicus]GLK73474.1 4-oxalocrotonate tautomerase [Ancylobacter dichloromethanicus]
MPMIQIRFAVPSSTPALEAALARRAAQLGQEWLGKDPSVTAVLVEPADPAHWFCAGRSLKEAGLAAFWLDIRVTEGTNTKDEKAAFVAATFTAFGELLGPLHAESYVHVVEARGDAYGYGGLTQERRYIAARPA